MIRKTALLVTGTIAGVVGVVSYNPPQLTKQIAPSATTPAQSPAANTGISGTFMGNTSQTRWGPVQVQVTLVNGRITDVTTLQFPSGDRKSQSISSRVVPWLQDEVLQVQSAKINGVSGATYTSGGFKTSLASALQKAGL